MEVIAAKIQKEKHQPLHYDFIEETCRSFNAILKNTNELPKPSARVIALRHDKGMDLETLDFSGVDTVLVGCDDSGNDDWMDEY